ncbi:ATP-binding protein [Gloeobacter morelensis]|uniref:histidine kinase n=1 Tax=Gloeobacter morelensis MG652769 TaxID=2781736 RepID=A0ABY3PGR2_9CYAN|nr:ATP-binding protein [Gloeobacter morelensis]UFP92834.1 PAS domain S-box protein [Gloeobacter morelensis MG652769]
MTEISNSLRAEKDMQAARKRIAQLEETCRRLQADLARTNGKAPTQVSGVLEESWRSLVQHVPDTIAAVDRRGCILFANRALSGLCLEQMIGQNLGDYLLPEHAERMGEVFAQVLATGEAESCEVAAPDAHGGVFWYRACVGPVVHPGQLTSLIAVFSDITERKRSEAAFAALLQREQGLHQAIEHSERRHRFLAQASVVLSSSLDAETTFANLARLVVPQIADGFAVDLVEPDGALRCLVLAHADAEKVGWARRRRERAPGAPGAAWGIAQVIRTGCPQLYSEFSEGLLSACIDSPEHLELLRRGSYRSAMVVPLVARGQTLGALTFVMAESDRRYGPSDLSLVEDLAGRAALAFDNARLYAAEQRERNRAEVANRAKDEFLATVSHELRTPLNSILGFTQLLRRHAGDPERLAVALDAIERNAKAQARLTEDLLDVSRIITGKLTLTVQPVRVTALVDAAIETMRTAAEAKKIALSAIYPEAPCTLQADPNRLQQVIWNLLSNAIKFTPVGGRIRVSVERRAGQVHIAVADSGMGIAAEFLPFVFDRFRQADSSSTRTFGGLGLGLAIVRHLVELHGGSVEAHSAGPNQGATFVVSLPLAP